MKLQFISCDAAQDPFTHCFDVHCYITVTLNFNEEFFPYNSINGCNQLNNILHHKMLAMGYLRVLLAYVIHVIEIIYKKVCMFVPHSNFVYFVYYYSLCRSTFKILLLAKYSGAGILSHVESCSKRFASSRPA